MSYLVDKRRRKIKNLFLRGYAPVDIAEKLGVNYAVVLDDLRIIRKKFKQSLQEEKETLKDILHQTKLMLDKYNQIEQEAWKKLEKAEPAAAASLLNVLTKINVEVSKLLRLVEPSKAIVNIQEYVQVNILPAIKEVVHIIDTYVPDDKKYEAIDKLQKVIAKTQERTKNG